jgi:hypothetical protein
MCGLSGFDSDTLFSLNSISSTVVPLEKCSVEVEEAKLGYLKDKKHGSIKKAGLISLAREEVQRKISERLASNYIFNMALMPEHQVMKFNTVLNFTLPETGKLVKLIASLEYEPLEQRLRLITMF